MDDPTTTSLTIDELAIESAKLLIQLRKQQHGSKYWYVYVLLLQNDNVYVGATNNIYMRLAEHLGMTSRSSAWVRAHGPVVRVLEIIKDATDDTERYKTLEWMDILGYRSVRGSCWNNVALHGKPPALKTFRRTRHDFAYVPRSGIDVIVDVSRELAETLSVDDDEEDSIS